MKLYVIRWLHDYYYLDTAFKGGVPERPAVPRLLKAFTDPLAAEEYRRELEGGVRAPPPEANPFRGLRDRSYIEGVRLTKLGDLTSFPAPVFADWLREVDLTPPAGGDWADWWDAHAADMTERQRARVWQALDRLRYFEIVATELEV